MANVYVEARPKVGRKEAFEREEKAGSLARGVSCHGQSENENARRYIRGKSPLTRTDGKEITSATNKIKSVKATITSKELT